MADRFYCPDPIVEGRASLVGDEARHLARVRRLGPGDRVVLFDGLGHAYEARVEAVGRDRVDLAIEAEAPPDRPAPCRLTVATAVPKGERFDWLVEKATELGVARLVPLITGRSVVDPRGAKIDRLRRAVVEASKQCGRSVLMVVEPPTAWADYLGAETALTRLLAHPGGSPPNAWPALDPGQDVALAIGPEGGFTDDEVARAREAGWRPSGLGDTTLRIETAALAGAAVIFSKVGEPS